VAAKLLALIPRASFHIDISMANAGRLLNVFAMDPVVAHQRQEASVSLNTSGDQGVLGNLILERVRDGNGTSLGYLASLPLIRAGSSNITLWTLVYTGLILSGNTHAVLVATFCLLSDVALCGSLSEIHVLLLGLSANALAARSQSN
jgi:hypothetical protein